MRIIRVAAQQLHLPTDRAVEQACVEMRQPEMRGERLGDGAFARSGGAIDGDDHSALSRASMRWSILAIQSR